MSCVEVLLKWAVALILVPASAQEATTPHEVRLTVVDEAGTVVAGAILTIQPRGAQATQLATDLEGQASYTLRTSEPLHIHIEKSGYFQDDVDDFDTALRDIHLELRHVRMVMQSVDVSGAPQEIDPQQVSDRQTLDTPEIANIPYPTSRDIRQLLQYFPGVIQDSQGHLHLAGSETWSILDLLDGFDVRSPFNGALSMRFSADAVRSIDKEATRYPVEYGRNTGGVIAFHSDMGDDKFRYNLTDFLPQFEEMDGLRFDRLVPRFTFGGPIQKNRAWFFDGVETEFDQRYVPQLPRDQQTDSTSRGSNLLRVQWDAGESTTVKSGLLFNDFHTPYEGLSPADPQQTTTKHNTIAWMPYTRIEQRVGGGLMDAGFGVVRFSDSTRPYGRTPYLLLPEGASGAYFKTAQNLSMSVQSNAMYYMPPRRWLGEHDLKAGINLDQIKVNTDSQRAFIEYLAENRTLVRQSMFPAVPAFVRHNLAAGAFIEDHWVAGNRWLLEPGLGFDWNEITRHPMWSPRVSIAVLPKRLGGSTKIAGGIGIYYEHTQLEYLTRALGGVRDDTYFATDGITPLGPPLRTTFIYNQHSLKNEYAINWSLGLEQKLPGAVYLKVNYLHKRVLDGFTYVNVNGPGSLFGTYTLTNNRRDLDTELDIEARHTFHGNYTLEGAYSHSVAHTNAVIDYQPDLSYLGTQQSGPLPWDTPDKVSSWGWFPFPISKLANRWNFGYSVMWHTGFPYTAINANHQVVGRADGLRFPNYLAFNPGVEFRFHFRGSHFALRTVVENATGAADPYYVNNNVDSPGFGRFDNPPGRTVSARLVLLDSKGKGGLFH
jgi:hypothetical protein